MDPSMKTVIIGFILCKKVSFFPSTLRKYKSSEKRVFPATSYGRELCVLLAASSNKQRSRLRRESQEIGMDGKS